MTQPFLSDFWEYAQEAPTSIVFWHCPTNSCDITNVAEFDSFYVVNLSPIYFLFISIFVMYLSLKFASNWKKIFKI